MISILQNAMAAADEAAVFIGALMRFSCREACLHDPGINYSKAVLIFNLVTHPHTNYGSGAEKHHQNSEKRPKGGASNKWKNT